MNFAEIKLGHQLLFYSQEVFFLGFPFGWQPNVGPINNGYPMPYVKRAIVSMIEFDPLPRLVLDGINNPGFSGGPVAFQSKEDGTWRIAGVVTEFNYARGKVFKGETDEPAGYTVEENTGLIEIAPFTAVLPLIVAKPIGFII